jgi:hypothetical protein
MQDKRTWNGLKAYNLEKNAIIKGELLLEVYEFIRQQYSYYYSGENEVKQCLPVLRTRVPCLVPILKKQTVKI